MHKAIYTPYDLNASEIYSDSKFNSRGSFLPHEVKELAGSIKHEGLIEPIIVQPIEDIPSIERPNDNIFKWRVVAGHRRLAAICFFLHWEQIPCRIIKGLNSDQAQTLNLVENLERKDLNILQESQMLERIWSGLSTDAVAGRLNRSNVWVLTRRRLLNLPEEIQNAAASGRLTSTNIYDIGKQPNTRQQMKLFKKIIGAKRSMCNRRFKKNQTLQKQRRLIHQIRAFISYIFIELQEHNFTEKEIQNIASILSWTIGDISTKELLETRLNVPYNIWKLQHLHIE